MGRPSSYKPEVGIQICEIIATSNKSMDTICKELNIPIGTVLKWISGNEEFRENYTRAKEFQADFLAEEMLEIADDSRNDTMTIYKDGHEIRIEDKEWTGRVRLRIEARKWIASKLKPKKYGDKLDITSEGERIKPDLSMLPTDTLKALIDANRKPEGDR